MMIEIVLGCGENKNSLLASEIANENNDLHVKLAYNDEELVAAMTNNEIDAVIRGSLKSSNILKNIRDLYSDKAIYRVSYIKNEIGGKEYEFLLAPVGIDEGISLDEKLDITTKAIDFMLRLGKNPKIAILAGGRKEDLGRSCDINKSIKDSEDLTKKVNELIANSRKYQDKDITLKNYYILIEKAIKENNNIIIAPDGIYGNIIFRTLVLVNSWHSYGAIALGIDKIFIDTSRDQSIEGYLRSINFAYELAKERKKVE